MNVERRLLFVLLAGQRAVYAELGGEGGPSETAFAVKAIFPRENNRSCLHLWRR